MLSSAFLLVLVAAASAVDYCSICSDQTMCLYSGVGPDCGTPMARVVTDGSIKQQIVAVHNAKRNQVALGQESRGQPGPQPAASDMKLMSWDDELATVAQRWADQCTWDHDKCRNVQRFKVGQNMAQQSSTSPDDKSQDWVQAIDDWYEEVTDQSANKIAPFVFTYATGHYTQVVWGNSNKVGCGFTMYAGDDGWYNKLYVCNYGPGGNVQGMGTPAYTIGQACSKCSNGCDSTYTGLCK